MERMIKIIRFTNGMKSRITHQPGRPATLQRKYIFTIGIIAAQPGWPALVNTFHIAATIKMMNAISQIQNTGPGPFGASYSVSWAKSAEIRSRDVIGLNTVQVAGLAN